MQCQSQRVLITGASSGIGAACARQFAKEGADLLLCARRTQQLQELKDELIANHAIAVHIVTLDVCDPLAVTQAWQQLPEEWRNIDILVNNAGLSVGLDPIQAGHWQDWERMIDTNIKGVLHMTQHVIKQMLLRQRGHVINMGSIAGYQVYPGGMVYAATKFALRAISDGLKMDVHGTPIRVSLINPGMVAETEFSVVRFKGDVDKAAAVYQDVKPLTADDIADVVVFCATRPLHVDVREITILPTMQTAVHMLQRTPSSEQ